VRHWIIWSWYTFDRWAVTQTNPPRPLLTHSLTHCCAWPAEGRSVLHIERSWPAIQAAPTDRPTSSSTCCSQFLRGRPGGTSSVPPVPINVLLLTDACLIYNSFVFIVSIVLSLYRLCTLSCTFFMHVWCLNSIKYEYEYRSIELYHFQWYWITPKQDFKVTSSLDAD